jgi:2-polyprenyl-3-methyl-5-hydroxy-6-metoxy-1,4-benzoquinol methylase
MDDQQEQTYRYFNSNAEDWNNKAQDSEYSLIQNRHNAVLQSFRRFAAGSRLLDVGCGTGQLCVQAANLGWRSLGIDFAQDMVELAIQNNAAEKSSAEFRCVSIFDSSLPGNSFDVISAQGFIEYISLSQLDQFLETAHHLLGLEGRLVLGSRNRLFNLHSLNEFTELEVALGTINQMMAEGIILQTAASQREALSQLTALGYQYEQPTVHPMTGIEVETRYQFTPADLITRLARHHFIAENIYPVHFHPFPLSILKNSDAGFIHKQLANLAAEDLINEHCLVPYSSSFVIQAVKQ